MIRASEMQTGRVYVPARAVRSVGNIFYTVAPPGATSRVVKRWKDARLGRTLQSRESFLLNRIEREGCLLIKRFIRFLDAKNKKHETTQWAAVLPDREMRELKRRPGYRGATQATEAP